MRKTMLLLCALALTSLAGAQQSRMGPQARLAADFEKAPSQVSLSDDFKNPPSSVRIACYWYWISDNLSQEGIIRDLQAMKKAGIGRAYIGNIGLDDKGGTVKFGSEEWWAVLHTAMKTATELDIELGMFNSPGWSQSGGPWVKPEQAMRYLTATKTMVEGGRPVNLTLAKPEGDFQDVKVLAYPVEYRMQPVILGGIMANPELPDVKKLVDGDTTTGTVLAGDSAGNLSLELALESEQQVRSLKIYTHDYSINTTAEFQVREGDKYRSLAQFKLDRYNTALNVGFNPRAPIVISLPPTTARDFRLVVHEANANTGLSEIELSSMPYVERYPEKTLAKMFQEPLPYWHEYQWRTQPPVDDPSWVVDPARVLDLSAFLLGDQLAWDAPAGNWVIMRMGAKPTGVENAPASKEATGLEVDKMSKEHIASHFNAFMGEVIRRIPPEDRKSWKVVVMDSYEMGGQNYTDTLFADFQKKYGYDPVPFLPVLEGIVVKSQDASDRFLWDLRRLVADKVAYDYIGGLREISNKNGLTTWLENYGHWGFPGEFLQYGGQSDEIGGEFWATGTLGDIENRASSSSGHIYGKKKIYSESFTSGNLMFSNFPGILKQRGDRFFSEGINSTLLHVYIHQPYEDRRPGINAWFGTEFNRFNTWFPQMDLFTDYLRRVNYMLQQGLNVADVAYFIGEDTPKMTGEVNPPLPRGYQFDYINAEVIEKSLTVKKGLLTLPHGTQYKLLVLPKLETMRPELLKKIKKLIEQGAVVLGPAPSRSPSYQNYPNADAEVQKLASQMWTGGEDPYRNMGKGLLINGVGMEEALAAAHCTPDFRFEGNLPVVYAHRTSPDAEIYFVANQGGTEISFLPEFRVKGMSPEWWEPTTGTIRELPAFSHTLFGTVVPMRLAPYESVFIVFKGKNVSNLDSLVAEKNCPQPQTVVELAGPWKVAFDNDYIGFQKEVEMPKLENLAANSEPDLKYYSGTIRYSTTFELASKPQGSLFVNLNEVHVMAKVKVNGQYVGGVWTAPWRLEVTDWVKEGTNQIEVEVVNTWGNRLVGDLNLPENQRKVWLLHNGWNAKSDLPASGLVGPVRIESMLYLSDR